LRQDADLEVARGEFHDVLQQAGVEGIDAMEARQGFGGAGNGEQREFFHVPIVIGLAALKGKALAQGSPSSLFPALVEGRLHVVCKENQIRVSALFVKRISQNSP
jgi:hypothetical protein